MQKTEPVLFLESRRVQAVDGPHYKKGEIYDLPSTSADRWEARGVARRATADEVKAWKAAKAPKPAPGPAGDSQPGPTGATGGTGPADPTGPTGAADGGTGATGATGGKKAK